MSLFDAIRQITNVIHTHGLHSLQQRPSDAKDKRKKPAAEGDAASLDLAALVYVSTAVSAGILHSSHWECVSICADDCRGRCATS